MRRVALSCLSVRPSAWNNAVPAGGIFLQFCINGVLLRSVEKIQVWLNSDKNDRHIICIITYMNTNFVNNATMIAFDSTPPDFLCGRQDTV
jgi:hypothetical protein